MQFRYKYKFMSFLIAAYKLLARGPKYRLIRFVQGTNFWSQCIGLSYIWRQDEIYFVSFENPSKFIAYIYSIFSISLHFQIIIFSKVSKYILLLTMKLKGKQLNPIIILWVHVSTLNLTTFIDNLDKLLWKYFFEVEKTQWNVVCY